MVMEAKRGVFYDLGRKMGETLQAAPLKDATVRWSAFSPELREKAKADFYRGVEEGFKRIDVGVMTNDENSAVDAA